MAVAEEKVPPPPQQVPPLIDLLKRNPDIFLGSFRFGNEWMQWFQLVKLKIDVIDSNLYQLANVVGTGIPSRDGSGNWTAREIENSDSSIVVEDGDGVTGNPKIKINPLWTGQTTLTTLGTITTGVWQGTVIANAYLDAAPKMTATSTSAVGGAATALPALPVGYVEINIGGVIKKIAYYD